MPVPAWRVRQFTWPVPLLASIALVVSGCTSGIWTKPGEQAYADLHPPAKHSQRIGSFLFLSDFSFQTQHQLLNELANLEEKLRLELKLQDTDTLIQVFVFEDSQRYSRYMKLHYPELPERKAFFIAQKRHGEKEELAVYTYWSDTIRRDLRHELTHALVHKTYPAIPLWLDEGLAEFFELPPEKKGLNDVHVQQLLTYPDDWNLDRLESLVEVKQMDRAEYREAWAWTYFLLRKSPQTKQILIDYLKECESQPMKPQKLNGKLREQFPTLKDDLRKFLQQTADRG